MNDLIDIDLDFLPDNPEGIYIVGGTVRDLLAGRCPADIDLVVKGDINDAARHIASKIGGSIVELGKKGFDVLRVAAPRTTIDITPLDHPSIEADLLQRDFTINAMAYDVKARRLVDCTGGLADMRQQLICMVSPTAFENDPARLVRAYRMAAGFHFSVSDSTQDAIARYRHLIGTVAGERIWAELVKIFNVQDSAPIIANMAASGLLTAIFPDLQPAIGCTQNRHHQYDVYDHSLLTYQRLEDLLHSPDVRFANTAAGAVKTDLAEHTAMLKYSALLHDVGKPATRMIDDHGLIRFPGHAAKSADIAAKISARLKLSKKQREVADGIIRHHIRPLFLFLAAEKATLGHRGRVRFFTHCGDLVLPIIVHAMADIMAKGEVLQDRDHGFISFCQRLADEYSAFKDRQAAGPPLVNGDDLISIFGLSPSPRFKRILSRVDERRLTGELTSRDQALKWVRGYLNLDAPRNARA